MGSTARFFVLLAAGVAILVLYVRSGESIGVLALSLTTLVAGLAVWVIRPWEVGPASDDADRPRHRGAGQHHDDTWRCGYDITWDQQGIRAVAVGDRVPHLTVWSRIDGIDVGRHRGPSGHRTTPRLRGLRIHRFGAGEGSPGEPPRSELWLCVGPDQDPGEVAAALTATWRRIATSRWYPRPER